MATIVEQTPSTAEKTISLLDNDHQLSHKASKKIDYSSIRGKVNNICVEYFIIIITKTNFDIEFVLIHNMFLYRIIMYLFC